MEGGEDCCAASGILPVCRMGDQVLVLLYNATGGRKSRYLIDFGGRKERLIHPSNPTSPSLSSPQEHPSSSSCLSTTLQQQQEPPLPLAPSATPSSLLSPPSQASPSGGDRKGKKEKEQTAVTASPKASETERKSRQKKTTRGGDGWEDDECCAARELWEETGSCWGLATSTVLTSFPRKDGEETRQRTESRGEEDVSQVVERAGQSKSILEIGPNEQPRSEDGLSSLLHGEKEQRQHNGDVTRPRREPADKVCKDQEVDRLPDSSLDPLRQAFLQLLRRLPVLASFEHTKYRCLVKEFPFFLPLSFLNLRGEEGPTGLSRNRRFVWVNIDALISASKMVGAPSTTSRKEEQDGQSSNSSQALCMPGEENCLVPMKTPPEEFLPLHPRLHAKGLGALLEEVKAKLLQSSVTTPRSEQKLTGNVMPRVCEEHKVEETRGSCLVQSGEVKPEKPVGGRHRSGKESLEKTGERRNQELSSDFSTGETCEMGNLSGCCMETRQKTQNERRRSLEEVRRNMCIFTETKGNNRGHQESDEVASGRRERNGENDDVKERQGCPEQDQVGGDVEKHSYVLPEEFLQALLPTRYSFLQSVSSLESYFCQHVYGLLSRCRALPGEAHEKVGKTKERRKEEVTPKPAAERERREERTPSHQNHDSLDKEEERKDKQEERDYKERNKPPQFKGAIRATRHLLETDAWKRAKVVWVDLDFPSLQWLLSEEATQDKIFLTPPPPTTEPFLLTRLPTVYTLGDVPTSQSFDGKGVQTEDMKKKKTELEKSSSLSSCNCNNPGGVHKAGTEITKTEGSHGETQATTAPLIEETTFDGDEYENREKKRTREACGTSDSSDGRTGESTSVVTKEGEVAYVVWKFSRQHKAHVVVLQQGDAESASRESFGGLSVDIVLASCSAVTPEGCIFGTRPSYFETDPSQRPTVMTIAHDLQILEGFTPVVTHTSPRPNAVYDFASSVPFVASSSAGEAGEQRDASSALRDAPAGVKSLSTSAPLAPCRNGVPESEIAPFCTFNCQAMSLLSEGARVINLAVSRSRAFQSLSGNSVIPQKRRKEPGPATERGMSRLAHFIATPSRSWSVYGREVDIS